MINTIQISVCSRYDEDTGGFKILKQISGFRTHFNWTSYQLFPYSIYRNWRVNVSDNLIWIYDDKQNSRVSEFFGNTIILGETESDTIGEKQLFKWEKQVHEYLNKEQNGN